MKGEIMAIVTVGIDLAKTVFAVHDAADPAAICKAVTRPNMRFVPAKSIEQQSRLFVHRARQG